MYWNINYHQKAYVFAALLEYAVSNYLNRQHKGLLHSNNIRNKDITKYIDKYIKNNRIFKPKQNGEPKQQILNNGVSDPIMMVSRAGVGTRLENNSLN